MLLASLFVILTSPLPRCWAERCRPPLPDELMTLVFVVSFRFRILREGWECKTEARVFGYWWDAWYYKLKYWWSGDGGVGPPQM